jgi:hypothetical protein
MVATDKNITIYTVNSIDIGIYYLLVTLDDKYSIPSVYKFKITITDAA